MGNLLITALIALALSACGAPSTPDFMQKAAVSDMYEIESGKLAIQKGQSDPVIKFGQKMMDDHGNTTAELKSLVQTKNIKVDLPTRLDAKHQKLIDDLNNASVHDFDKAYAKQQVDGHEDAKGLFTQYAKSGGDADVRQFANKTLATIIEPHLEEAKKLQLEMAAYPFTWPYALASAEARAATLRAMNEAEAGCQKAIDKIAKRASLTKGPDTRR